MFDQKNSELTHYFHRNNFQTTKVPPLKLKTEGSNLVGSGTEATTWSTARGKTPQISARLFRAKSQEMNHLMVGKFDGRKPKLNQNNMLFKKAGDTNRKKYNYLYNQYLTCKKQVNKGNFTSRGFAEQLKGRYVLKDIEDARSSVDLKLISYLMNGNKIHFEERINSILTSPKKWRTGTIDLTGRLSRLI